jgi:hypothetical protein
MTFAAEGLSGGTVGYLEELNIFIIVLQDIAGQCKTVEDSAGECRLGSVDSVGQ